MKAKKRLFMIGGVCMLQFFVNTAWASEPITSPCYMNQIDREHSNFDEGVWKYKFLSSSGVEVILEHDISHTFFMVNGNITDDDMVLVNNRAFAEIKEFCQYFNLAIKEDADTLVITSNNDEVVIDKKALTMEKNHNQIQSKCIFVNNKIYIPIREFANLFHVNVTYQKSGIMPMMNPLINIDNRKQTVTKEQAVTMIKEKLTYYNQEFESKGGYANQDSYIQNAKKEIQEKINDLHYVDETASYWIIRGPLLFLVDKTSGSMYVKEGTGHAGHGSYIEGIFLLDEIGSDMFEYMLVRGFDDEI